MPSRPDRTERLVVGDVELVVDLDDGARAIAWTVGDLSLLAHPGDDPVEHGMYPMAPWAGRLRGNAVEWAGRRHALPSTYGPWALHGTAMYQRAEILRAASDDGSALVVARVTDHPGWPWPMAIDVGWELRARTLTATLAVHALAEPFPVVVGWHPWFRRRLDRGEPMRWSLEATGRLERGGDHLPTGRMLAPDPTQGPFDDAFLVPDGRASAVWPGALALDVGSDGEWYVVYDERPDCVCLEPQSGPPDGLRQRDASDDGSHAVRVAAPGRPHTLTTTWTMHPLR